VVLTELRYRQNRNESLDLVFHALFRDVVTCYKYNLEHLVIENYKGKCDASLATTGLHEKKAGLVAMAREKRSPGIIHDFFPQI